MVHYHGDSDHARTANIYAVWAIEDAHGEDFELRYISDCRVNAQHVLDDLLEDENIEDAKLIRHTLVATLDDLSAT